MAIEKVRDFFGVKYLIPYNVTSRKPLVVLRAIGEISFENERENIPLQGGHTEAPWDMEPGQPTPSMSGTVREYPAELYEVLETVTIVNNNAEASGSVNNITNHQGTSIFGGANGISNVTANPSQLANLIFGEYVFRASAAQTLELYINGLTDTFERIDGRHVATISTTGAGSVQINDAGIVLTVVGTPAYQVGDTFACNVRPVNTGSTEILVGTGNVPSNFGVKCILPRKTDGVLHIIDVFNVVGSPMPWKAVSREWSEFDFTWNPIARASDGAVYSIQRVLA